MVPPSSPSTMRRHTSKITIGLAVIVLYLLFFRSDGDGDSEYSGSTSSPPPSRISGSSGIFKSGASVPEKFPPKNNLAAQHEGVSEGFWHIDPPLPRTLSSTRSFTIRFKCTWHPDFCPGKYVVVARGPTIYTPPLSAYTLDPQDPTVVVVKMQIADPGHYKIYAWPDFAQCHKYWRENMKFPLNRGQVAGTPIDVTVNGPAAVPESLEPCTLNSPENTGGSNGRWIARSSLRSKYQSLPWVANYPQNIEYIYQPYSCKRPHHEIASINDVKSVTHFLMMGDSVSRGSFCAQIWPKLSASGKADGDCTYVNDPVIYHASGKNMDHTTPDGRPQPFSFRFIEAKPAEKISSEAKNLKSPPSHVVANAGLWLADFKPEDYRAAIKSFLERIHELWPEALIIWRTTTDVMPMIECFTDKGMTRAGLSVQRDMSLEVVKELRQKGMNLYVVDAYAMTRGRPEAGNDGRHWVMESPDERNWLPKARPSIDETEYAVLDAIWSIILQDDERRRKNGRQ